MRLFNIVLFFAVFITAAFASPLEIKVHVPVVDSLDINFACTYFGINAICTARCPTMGYRSGYCNANRSCECYGSPDDIKVDVDPNIACSGLGVNTVCAVECPAMGHKAGYCNEDGICECYD